MTGRAEKPPTQPSRSWLIAWGMVVALAVGSMMATWNQIARHNGWLASMEEQRVADQEATPRGSDLLLQRQAEAGLPRSFWWAISLRDGLDVLQVGLLVGAAGLSFIPARSGNQFSPSRLRSPRPGPGRIATVFSAGVLILAFFLALRSAWVDPLLDGSTIAASPGDPGQIWTRVAATGGEWLPTTVAVAWIYLAASGQWSRRADDRIDRLGRLLGWTWIGLGLLKTLLGVVR